MIKSLGYLGIEAKDPAGWRSFATDVLGLQHARAGDHDRFRMDAHDWRIDVTSGERDDVVFVGWEVAGEDALTDLQAALSDRGVGFRTGTADEVRNRAVCDLIVFDDPSGLRLEAYYGPTYRYENPFHPSRPISGFVTGAQGLGHIVINAKDKDQAVAFYDGVLGFKVTDHIRFSPFPGFDVDLTFMRCNSRHHSLAIGQFPFPKRVQHVMLEYGQLDDVGRIYDDVTARNLPVTLTLGRHSNDHMVSFYMTTPSGFDVEVGWGALDVDDSGWNVQLHRHQSIWGHKPGPGLVLPSELVDPNKRS